MSVISEASGRIHHLIGFFNPVRTPHSVTSRRTTDNFIKSLMYKQVPLTAFLNRRTMLAFFSLFVGFLLITFVLPFYALIRNRKSFEVSIQMTAALSVFFIASLIGNKLI